MLFSEYARYQYVRSPLVEVICQLRFPAILTINTKEPAEFQEAVRHDFPRYAARKEQLPPKVTGLGTPNPKLEQQPAVVNHSFVSADGLWKINLTKDFIALSTLRYTQWEDFALRLDQASGAVHSGVRARLLRARGAAVCKRGLPEGPGAHRPAVGRSDPFPLPGHPMGSRMWMRARSASRHGHGADPGGGRPHEDPRRPPAGRRQEGPRAQFILDGVLPIPGSTAAVKVPSFWVTCTSTPYAFSTAPSPRSSMRPWGLSPFWNSRKKRRPLPDGSGRRSVCRKTCAGRRLASRARAFPG